MSVKVQPKARKQRFRRHMSFWYRYGGFRWNTKQAVSMSPAWKQYSESSRSTNEIRNIAMMHCRSNWDTVSQKEVGLALSTSFPKAPAHQRTCRSGARSGSTWNWHTCTESDIHVCKSIIRSLKCHDSDYSSKRIIESSNREERKKSSFIKLPFLAQAPAQLHRACSRVKKVSAQFK